MPTNHDLRPDPADPVQGFDEASDFHLDPLSVEATPMAEADAELDEAVAEVSIDEQEDEEAGVRDLSTRRLAADDYANPDDTGELYGVHTPRALDPDIAGGPDHGSNADADLGENWLETLEKQAVEGGAVPEEELDVIDEEDVREHHSTDTRDRPVADKGAGGPGGL